MVFLPVREIFSSIQGEGPYVGVRQIFLRLPRCNLTCPYCDTPVTDPQHSLVEMVPGSRQFEYFDNPLSLKSLLDLLENFNFKRHHSLSITGGEPLLWSSELVELLPLVRDQGLKIYLETNGTLPIKLDPLLPFIDIISMDIKLPHRERTYWTEHKKFIQLCRMKELFIKIIVHSLSTYSDLHTARELIAGEDPEILTVLQPVTASRGLIPPKPRQMLEWQDYLLEELKNVRIIPQTHVLQGQL